MTSKIVFFLLPAFLAVNTFIYSSAEEKTGTDVKTGQTVFSDNQYAEISFASSDTRFPQDQKAFPQPLLQLNRDAWKNERISCQVLVWAKAALPGFKLVLANNTDKSFTADAIHFGFIKNVAADNSAGMCGSVPKNLPEIDVPDLISNGDSGTSISAGKLQAIWLTIHVPRDAPEGIHTINIIPQTQQGYDLPRLVFNINVNKNVLPDPAQWTFHLDMWQDPLRVAKYYNVKPWSPEHFNFLRPEMQQLANAGQKAITASFFWDKMNNQNYGYDNLMVKVTGTSNNALQFDFTNFDKWVEFMMGLGINSQINCFGMYPFTNNLNYYVTDPVQKKTVTNSFALSSNDYNTFWTSFLKAFAQHLRQKGWMNKTVLYFDERPPKNVINIISLINKIDPAFKIGYTGAYNATLNPMLYDFSIPSYLKIPDDVLAQRRQSNRVTTFYTTCFEKKPNVFTNSDPAECTFMGWYAFANNYDGFLRYTFDMWETNSTTDTRSSIVPAGDKFITYPDSYSSVRFEKLTEGAQDYEKLNIIATNLRQSNNRAQLQKINALLNNFKIDNVKNISDYTTLVENAEKTLNSF